jgi:hypothetical protein
LEALNPATELALLTLGTENCNFTSPGSIEMP